jgi:hypothetical protein
MIMRPQTYPFPAGLASGKTTIRAIAPPIPPLGPVMVMAMKIWESSYGLSWLDLTIKLWESPLGQQPPRVKVDPAALLKMGTLYSESRK